MMRRMIALHCRCSARRWIAGLPARDESFEEEVAQLLADALRRTLGAIVEQHRANAAEDREGGGARVGVPEHAGLHPFLDERGEEHEAALAPALDQAIARLGQPRLLGRDEAQQVAALIVKLDGDLDGAAQPVADILAGIVGGLRALAHGLEPVAQDAEVQRFLRREIEIERALGDAGRLGHAIHRDGLVGLIGKQAQSRGEDAVALIVAIAVSDGLGVDGARRIGIETRSAANLGRIYFSHIKLTGQSYFSRHREKESNRVPRRFHRYRIRGMMDIRRMKMIDRKVWRP